MYGVQAVTMCMCEQDGWTPLHIACNKGHLEVAQWLLDNGATADRLVQDSCKENIKPQLQV